MNLSANYILLDSAKMDSDLAIARELNPEHTCLYEGESERSLGVVAPWLFAFEDNTPFAAWISENAPSNNWGVFFRSEEEPIKLYKHLRKFLIVSTEDGRELYFRFYDPRVLRVFLPTCDRDQLREFFGPIDAFIAEDENGLLIEYCFNNEKLQFSDVGTQSSTFLKKDKDETIQKENQVPDKEAAQTQNQDKSIRNKDLTEDKSEDEVPDKTPGWDFGY